MMRHRFSATHLLIAVLAGIASQAARAQSRPPTIHAIFVSDVHFDPFWDPAKTAKLAASPASKWRAILAAPASPNRRRDFDALMKTCPSRGDDTSYPLLASSIAAMRAHSSDARFVLMSGDLMAHNFDCKFRALFPQAQPGQYRSFTEKTIRFVMAQLATAAPQFPVYATLGNNDSDCGDYRADAHSAFLESAAQSVARTFPRRERAAAIASFSADGSYSITLPPPMQDTRLIAIDDVFLSAKHTACSGAKDKPDQQQLIGWLGRELDAAKAAHQKIWVMAHIPPGIDAYATLAHITGACGRPPRMLLSSGKLAETLIDSPATIPLAVFGHTHEDEMAMLQNPTGETADSTREQQAIPVKIVPSISPINGNDPSFTVAEIDPATATLVDYQVIAGGILNPWTQRYAFAKAYREPSFSGPAVADLIGKFARDPQARTPDSEHYIRNFLTGSRLPLLSLVWPQYVCTMDHTSAQGFTSCACKQK